MGFLLKDCQQRFQASLLLHLTDPILFSKFNNEDTIQHNLHERFDVYRNNLCENLFKTLKNIYPVCCLLVGEACFRALSMLFIQKSISEHFSLNAFGRRFSFFLEKYAKEWSLSYLSDIATLEWMIHLSLIGPKNSSFLFETLSRIPEAEQSDIVFTLAENGYLFFSPFQVDKIWIAHQDLQDLPENQELIDNINIQLAEEERFLFIYRSEQDYSICLVPLSKMEWLLLESIEKGSSLGALYQMFSKVKPQEIVATLALCVQKGFITGLKGARIAK